MEGMRTFNIKRAVSIIFWGGIFLVGFKACQMGGAMNVVNALPEDMVVECAKAVGNDPQDIAQYYKKNKRELWEKRGVTLLNNIE